MDGKKNPTYLKHSFLSFLNIESKDDYSDFNNLRQNDAFQEHAGHGDCARNNSSNKRSIRNKRRREDSELQRNNSGKPANRGKKKGDKDDQEDQKGKKGKSNTEKRKAVIAPKKDKFEPVKTGFEGLSKKERQKKEAEIKMANYYEQKEKKALKQTKQASFASSTISKAPDTRSSEPTLIYRKEGLESSDSLIAGPSGVQLKKDVTDSDEPLLSQSSEPTVLKISSDVPKEPMLGPIDESISENQEPPSLVTSSTLVETTETSETPPIEDAVIASDQTEITQDVFEEPEAVAGPLTEDLSRVQKFRSWSKDMGYEQMNYQRRGFADSFDDGDLLGRLDREKMYRNECADFWDSLGVNVKGGPMPSTDPFYDVKLREKHRVPYLSATIDDYPVSNKRYWDQEARIEKNLARFSRDIASSALTRRKSVDETTLRTPKRKRHMSARYGEKTRSPKYWKIQKNLLKYERGEEISEKRTDPKDPFFYDQQYKESFADKEEYGWNKSYWKKQKKFQEDCKNFWAKMKEKFPRVRRRSLTDALRLQPDIVDDDEMYYKKHNLAGLKEQHRQRFLKRFEAETMPSVLKTKEDLFLEPTKREKYKFKRFSEDFEDVPYEAKDRDYWKKVLAQVQKALYKINYNIFKRQQDLRGKHNVPFLDPKKKTPITKKEFQSRRQSFDLDIAEHLIEDEKTMAEYKDILKNLKRLIREKEHKRMQARKKQELISRKLDEMTTTDKTSELDAKEKLEKIKILLEDELKLIDELECPPSTPEAEKKGPRYQLFSPRHQKYQPKDSSTKNETEGDEEWPGFEEAHTVDPSLLAEANRQWCNLTEKELKLEPPKIVYPSDGEWPEIEEAYTVDPSELDEADRHWCNLTEEDLKLKPPKIVYPSEDTSSPRFTSSGDEVWTESDISGYQDPFEPTKKRYGSDESIFSAIDESNVEYGEKVEPEDVCCICQRPHLNRIFALMGHISSTKIMGLSNYKKKNTLATHSNTSYDQIFSLLRSQISKQLSAPSPTKWYNNAVVKTCGHFVHYDCYFNSQRSKALTKEDFTCGTCMEMMNCVVPMKAEESSSLIELDFNLVTQAFQRFSKEKIDLCEDQFKLMLQKKTIDIEETDVGRDKPKKEPEQPRSLKDKTTSYQFYVDLFRNNIEILLMNKETSIKFDYKKFIPIKSLFIFCGKYVRRNPTKDALVHMPNMDPERKVIKNEHKTNLVVSDIKHLLLTTLLFNRDPSRSLIKSVICYYYNLYVMQIISWYVACLNERDVKNLKKYLPRDEPLLRYVIAYLAEKINFISSEWKKEEEGKNIYAKLLEGMKQQILLYLKFSAAVYCCVTPGTDEILENIEQMKVEELLETLFGGEAYFDSQQTFINIYYWDISEINSYLDKFVLDFKSLKNFNKKKLKKLTVSEKKSKLNPFKKVSSLFLSIFKAPTLVNLPATFGELIEYKRSNMSASQNVLCLVCLKSMGPHEETKIKHARKCGNGTCVFLDVVEKIIEIVWNEKPIKWRAIYASGQLPSTQLDKKKFKSIEKIWLYDAFDMFLKKIPTAFYH